MAIEFSEMLPDIAIGSEAYMDVHLVDVKLRDGTIHGKIVVWERRILGCFFSQLGIQPLPDLPFSKEQIDSIRPSVPLLIGDSGWISI